MVRHVTRKPLESQPLDLAGIEIAEACRRVLRLPAVADKSFLIHIGDRTVGGLVCRDLLVLLLAIIMHSQKLKANAPVKDIIRMMNLQEIMGLTFPYFFINIHSLLTILSNDF